MKKIFLYILVVFALVGCGGGGGDTASASSSKSRDYPSDEFSGKAYSVWEYVIPDVSKGSNSISSRGLNSNSYHATFRSVDDKTVVETPANTTDEQVKYKKNSDKISVSFYKNNSKTFAYNLKKSVHIGEQTTVEKSACMLINHYESYSIDDTSYKDVIEIACGKHKGLYAKGKGEIARR